MNKINQKINKNRTEPCCPDQKEGFSCSDRREEVTAGTRATQRWSRGGTCRSRISGEAVCGLHALLGEWPCDACTGGLGRKSANIPETVVGKFKNNFDSCKRRWTDSKIKGEQTG